MVFVGVINIYFQIKEIQIFEIPNVPVSHVSDVGKNQTSAPSHSTKHENIDIEWKTNTIHRL